MKDKTSPSILPIDPDRHRCLPWLLTFQGLSAKYLPKSGWGMASHTPTPGIKPMNLEV